MAGHSECQGASRAWSRGQLQGRGYSCGQCSTTGTQLVQQMLHGKEGWSAPSLALAGGAASTSILCQRDTTLGTKQPRLLAARVPTVLGVRQCRTQELAGPASVT